VTPKYRCWAEVDLNALRENLAWIRHRVGPRVKIMTVVKADAYGHGLKPIAALLMQSGTDIFGVANLMEARSIRSVGKGWPILMLGACLPDEIETAVAENVMPTISSVAEAELFSARWTCM
jgi:alanine racemase